MLLRLSYLALSTVFAFARLLPMSDTDKDVEILALRHQLAVLQRQIDRQTPPHAAGPGLSSPPSCTDYHGRRCGSCT
jgi:hypothetical protein